MSRLGLLRHEINIKFFFNWSIDNLIHTLIILVLEIQITYGQGIAEDGKKSYTIKTFKAKAADLAVILYYLLTHQIEDLNFKF